MALHNNSRIDNARLQIEKADDAISAVRTKLFPEVGFDVYQAYHLTNESYEFGRGVFGTYPIIGPVPAENTSIDTTRDFATRLSLSVKQPISQLYEILLLIKQKGVEKEVFQQDLRSKSQEVADKVKETYCDILKTEALLKAIEEKILFLTELDKLVEKDVKDRRALKSDSLDVKARLGKAEYEAFTGKNALATQREVLNELLGRDIGTPFGLSPLPTLFSYKVSTANAEEKALAQRPEIIAASLNLEFAEDEVRLKKAKYIPEVSLLFRYSSNPNTKLLPENIATIGIYAKWDIIDWGLKQKEIAEKQKSVFQAKNLLSEAESRVRIDVNEKVRKLREARMLVDVTSQEEMARKEKLRTVMNKYKERSALLQEVLEAQSRLEEAEKDWLQAILDCWAAKANLERALGEL